MKEFLEDEILSGMQNELNKQASFEKPSLIEAGECLHAALEIFESAGLTKRANEVLWIMQKIAKKANKSDRHTKNLTPEKQIKNLEEHGTVFNMAHDHELFAPLEEFGDLASAFDMNDSDNFLEADVEMSDDELFVIEKDVPLTDFEDEKD